MASCRCTEISNISDDIGLFNEIKSNIETNDTRLLVVKNNCHFLSTKELNFYDADYISDVSERIEKIDDTLPEDYENIILAIESKISDLNSRKSELESEDKEYHDEQDRLEEEKKQSEIVKD